MHTSQPEVHSCGHPELSPGNTRGLERGNKDGLAQTALSLRSSCPQIGNGQIGMRCRSQLAPRCHRQWRETCYKGQRANTGASSAFRTRFGFKGSWSLCPLKVLGYLIFLRQNCPDTKWCWWLIMKTRVLGDSFLKEHPFLQRPGLQPCKHHRPTSFPVCCLCL